MVRTRAVRMLIRMCKPALNASRLPAPNPLRITGKPRICCFCYCTAVAISASRHALAHLLRLNLNKAQLNSVFSSSGCGWFLHLRGIPLITNQARDTVGSPERGRPFDLVHPAGLPLTPSEKRWSEVEADLGDIAPHTHTCSHLSRFLPRGQPDKRGNPGARIYILWETPEFCFSSRAFLFYSLRSISTYFWLLRP